MSDSSSNKYGQLSRQIPRRQLLQTTAVLGVGTMVSTPVSSTVQSNDTIFENDFETDDSGDVPDDFVLAGNTDQHVTDTTAARGSQSYKMNGSHGGCWRAIMRTELFDSSSKPETLHFQGSFRLGDGGTGCHEDRSGRIGWRTVDSSSWSDGSGTNLLQFRPNGDVTSAGETVGEFERDEWTAFSIEYRWDPEQSTVTHGCKIGDQPTTEVTREQRDDEADLTALELRSDDFTVYWDELVVEEITEGDPAFSITDLTTNAPLTAGETLTVDAEIENTGAVDDTQTVALDVFDRTEVDTVSVSLAAGESTTTTLRWDTILEESGEGNITVRSTDSEQTASILIEDDDQADVSLTLDIPETVEPHREVEVTGTAENTADVASETELELAVDGEPIETTETVPAGETVTLSGTVAVEDTDTTYTVRISHGEESETEELRVTEPSEISLELDIPETVEPHSSVELQGTVENSGDEDSETAVQLAVDDTPINTVDTVSGGETITLGGTIDVEDVGSTYEVSITHGDITETDEITVAEQPVCAGNPSMAEASISTPQDVITETTPAVVESTFRVDTDVPDGCTVVVEIRYRLSDSRFQFEERSEWDQSAQQMVATRFDEMHTGDVRTVDAHVQTTEATPGDRTTVEAAYELWYAGDRENSLQQTTEQTITVAQRAEPDDGSEPISVEVPGFGIPGSLAALGSVGYMLKRRMESDTNED